MTSNFFERCAALSALTRAMVHDELCACRGDCFRNSSLQGAYSFGVRAQGLYCGPMSGFDAAKVDAAFFPDHRYRTNFLLNIGYGDRGALRPRLPRLGFDEVARWE